MIYTHVLNRGGKAVRSPAQYRVCFYWENGYGDQVEITDYH
jgi:plasmid maintenance system killer protein